MAKKVIAIEVDVDDKDLAALEKKLKRVASNFNEVEKEADQASKSVDDVASNGGAIAILDQLTGGLATRIRDAYEASKLFNVSLKATRGALIATGIGAFVVAVGLLVEYWDDIVDFVNQTNEKLERQIEIKSDLVGQLEHELELLDLKEELLELQGESTEQIKEDRKEIVEDLIKENEVLLELLKTDLKREQLRSSELTLVEKIRVALGDAVGVAEGIISEDDRLALLEFQGQIEETEKKILALRIQREKIERGESVEGTRQERDLSSVNQLKRQSGTIEQAQLESDKVLEIVATRANNELEIERRLAEQKIALTNQTLGSIIQILGQNTAAGKAAAIAQALFNTYQGVTEVWSTKSSLLEPFATAQRLTATATVLASGLNAVRQIQSTQLPSFAGGGGFGGGGATQTPSFNVVGTSGTNQLAQVLGQQDNPVQAFVVGNNVTSQQALDRNIVETATIG